MKLICMSFDGGYVNEGPDFKTVDEAWEHADDMGSRWIFYPFCFVLTDSGKTVKAASENLERFVGKRLSTVIEAFSAASGIPELAEADADIFSSYLKGQA